MKTLILSILTLVLTSGAAHAYTSGQADPFNSVQPTQDKEYRTIAKSQTAGFSDAVAVGDILSYDTANTVDGGTVTRVGENSVVGANRVACVAQNVVATGDISEYRCVNKGYVTNLSYNASTAIAIGHKLCSNGAGQAVVCASCDSLASTNDCRFGTATGNSVIISLQVKASGSGSGSTGLKALILSR